MFTFRVFCEDKNLAKCLSALKGLCTIPETPQEVANADRMSGGRVVPRVLNGKALEVFKDHIKRNKIKTMTPADLREFMTSIGRKNYDPLLKKAVAAGILKKPTKKTTKPVYMVIQ